MQNKFLMSMIHLSLDICWKVTHTHMREHKRITLLICHIHTDRCKKCVSNKHMIHSSPNFIREVSWSNPQTHVRLHRHCDFVTSSFKTYTVIDKIKNIYIMSSFNFDMCYEQVTHKHRRGCTDITTLLLYLVEKNSLINTRNVHNQHVKHLCIFALKFQ